MTNRESAPRVLKASQPILAPPQVKSNAGPAGLSGWLSTTRVSLVIWIAFAVLYSVLRSRNYLAVDGAERAASVFQRGELFFHESNHLLYPFNVWVWNGALRLLGLGAGDALSYVRDTQIMNALAGAGSVAAVYWIGARLAKSNFLALASAIGFGVSRVAFLHFTNGAEPPMGLFWSLLAMCVLIASLERGSPFLTLAGGAILALALATYQSMLLIGGLAVALCIFWDAASNKRKSLIVIGTWRLALFTLGGLIATCIVFGSAYEYMGTSGLGPKLHRFVTIQGNDVYGGLSASKLANLPVGLAASLLPVLPTGYAGLRSLLLAPNALLPLLGIVTTVLSLAAVAVVSALRITRRHWNGSPLLPYAGIALMTALTIAILPCLYWNPIYEKLWLQPVAILACLVPLAFRGDADDYISPRSRSLVAGVILMIAASNLVWVVPASTTEIVEVRSAGSVVDLVTPNDLVICDWDGVSTLYKALTGSRYDTLDLPSTAGEFAFRAPEVVAERVRAARGRGGDVYFLGVLDQTPSQWQEFLGDRSGIRYEALDEYRRQARPLMVLETTFAKVTLWKLETVRSHVPDGVRTRGDSL